MPEAEKLYMNSLNVDELTPWIPYVDVLDTLPIYAYIARPDGVIVYLSKGWQAYMDAPGRELLLAEGYAAVAHADDCARVATSWDAACADELPYRDEFRLQIAPNTYRWIVNEARPMYHPETRAVLGLFGKIVDIDERKTSDLIIRSQANFLERLMSASYDCIKVLTLDAQLVSMNENGMKALGVESFSSVANTDWLLFWNGIDRENATKALATAQLGGQGQFVGRYDVEGEVRWWDVAVTSILGPDGMPCQLLVVSRDVTAIRLQQDERRRVRQRLHVRTKVLIDSGDLLLGSLDRSEILASVAQLAIASGASFCTLDMFSDDGIQRATAVHANPDADARIAKLAKWSPPLANAQHPVVKAFHDKSASYENQTDGRSLLAVDPVEELLLQALATCARLTVPLMTQNECFGAITFYIDETDRASGKYFEYDDDDLFFCKELGRRAGAALWNAWRYGKEHHIAFEMQKASLPTVLPVIDHLRFTADYRPGSSEATIGGDWYDAFKLDDTRIVLTVGDVLGNGLKAALTMTKLRLAMRTAAVGDSNPATILKVADRILQLEETETYATAVVALYNPVTHFLTVANAGHPAPLMRDLNGAIKSIDVSGMMLGIDGDAERRVISVKVPHGSALVFFTDGLLENTRDIETGYERLYKALALTDMHQPGNIAANLANLVLAGDELHDDLAIMVATVGVTAKIPVIRGAIGEEVVASSAYAVKNH